MSVGNCSYLSLPLGTGFYYKVLHYSVGLRDWSLWISAFFPHTNPWSGADPTALALYSQQAQLKKKGLTGKCSLVAEHKTVLIRVQWMLADTSIMVEKVLNASVWGSRLRLLYNYFVISRIWGELVIKLGLFSFHCRSVKITIRWTSTLSSAHVAWWRGLACLCTPDMTLYHYPFVAFQQVRTSLITINN